MSIELWHKCDKIVVLQAKGVGAVLCGDGRFDSPGFSAKYMTYYIQDSISKKIIALEVGMKSQVMNI